MRKGALVCVGCLLALPVFCRWLEQEVARTLGRADAQGAHGYPAVVLGLLVFVALIRFVQVAAPPAPACEAPRNRRTTR